MGGGRALPTDELMSKDKTVIKHYSMPESYALLIEKWSKITGMGYSQFIRQAVQSYIYELEKKYDNRKKA